MEKPIFYVCRIQRQTITYIIFLLRKSLERNLNKRYFLERKSQHIMNYAEKKSVIICKVVISFPQKGSGLIHLCHEIWVEQNKIYCFP